MANPTLCYHCGVESTENALKYYDNGNLTQPRYQCGNCQKFFTMGFHGRPQGRTYAKPRNVDPPELKGLSRECRCCGAVDNAAFKYYNNSNLSQPHFKCLSCGQQFQMRLVGTGEERRLVHISSHQRQSNSRRKKMNLIAKSSNDGDNICGDNICAMPVLEPHWKLSPTLTFSAKDTENLDLAPNWEETQMVVDPSISSLEPDWLLDPAMTLSAEELPPNWEDDDIQSKETPMGEPDWEFNPPLSAEDASYWLACLLA